MNVKNMYSLEIQYVFKTSFELVHWNTNKQTNKQTNKNKDIKINISFFQNLLLCTLKTGRDEGRRGWRSINFNLQLYSIVLFKMS